MIIAGCSHGVSWADNCKACGVVVKRKEKMNKLQMSDDEVTTAQIALKLARIGCMVDPERLMKIEALYMRMVEITSPSVAMVELSYALKTSQAKPPKRSLPKQKE